MHFSRIRSRALVALVALAALAPASPAGATTAHRPVRIGRHVYDVSTVDPHDAKSVGRFLEKLHGDHDDHALGWVRDANVPTATRRAIIAYVAQPGTITTTRTVVDVPATGAYAKYRCRIEVRRVESHTPGMLRWYYEQRVPFCFDGRRIQHAPRPTIRTNAYLGWGYRGANVEAYWFPAPTTFRVHSRGKFVLNIGWLTVNTHRPWIDSTVRGRGTSSSTGKCGCN